MTPIVPLVPSRPVPSNCARYLMHRRLACQSAEYFGKDPALYGLLIDRETTTD